MKLNRWLAGAAIAATLIGASPVLAQDAPPPDRPPGGGPGGRNFDPAQFRQRMLDNYKEQLEISDDGEWKAIQPLVEKVMQARMAVGMGGGGMYRRNRGGDGAARGQFGQPNPEAEALQKAIEAKASGAELKAAVAKYRDARKAKQAELEKAQAELRKVLTVRQEAIATASGLL